MKWDVSNDDAAQLFDEFGSFLKERIAECSSMPTRLVGLIVLILDI
jgi:hypothetical protein